MSGFLNKSCFILFFISLISTVVFGKHFKDTVHFRKQKPDDHIIVMSDSSLEALGLDSLLNKIEYIHNTLTNIINVTGIGFDTKDIDENFGEVDSNIEIIAGNLDYFTNNLDVKNLQMFDVFLYGLHGQLNNWRTLLFKYDKELLVMNIEIAAIKKDTLLAEMLADSVFQKEYAEEIKDLKLKTQLASKMVAGYLEKIKEMQVNISNRYFETLDLKNKINDLLSKTSEKILLQETNFLWEQHKATPLNKKDYFQLANRVMKGRKKILFLYFKKIRIDIAWMLTLSILFYVWVRRNFLKLNKSDGISIDNSTFNFISNNPILPSVLIMTCIAPFFDLHPPTSYVVIIEFLLVITLTIPVFKTWSKKLFIFWVVIAILYCAFTYTCNFISLGVSFRWLLFTLNLSSIIIGIFLFIFNMKNTVTLSKIIGLVILIFVSLNIIGLVSNCFGRISVSKIVSETSISGLTQIIGLSVFIDIVIEALHLQTLVNQLKGGLIGKLNFISIEKLIKRLLIIVAIFIWIIVFTVSLNLYNTLFDNIYLFLTITRRVGTTEFQIGNVLLFVGIIYISNLFQQGVGSLYGKENSKWDPEIKKNASRLAMSRLILIVLGFLIAVAASGLPIDKITIVLGALGVGIGLGLQTIVNNLVSGVILIFEQPFRIGDFIEIGDKKGRVLDIGIRASKIVMDEGAEVIIPNGDLLAGRVINWTLKNDYARIEFSVKLAGVHILEKLEEIISDELHKEENVVKELPIEVLLTAINEKTSTINILVWIHHVNIADSIKSSMLNRIYNRLASEGIKISEFKECILVVTKQM